MQAHANYGKIHDVMDNLRSHIHIEQIHQLLMDKNLCSTVKLADTSLANPDIREHLLRKLFLPWTDDMQGTFIALLNKFV